MAEYDDVEGGSADGSPFGPPPSVLPWEEGDDPAVLGDGFAIETRAEKLELLTFGDALHRGEQAHLRTGAVEQFVDTVTGEERGTVRGRLTERTAKAARLTSLHQQTTVHGRLSLSAVGWPENAMSGEDGINPRRRDDRHVDRGSAHRRRHERRHGHRRGCPRHGTGRHLDARPVRDGGASPVPRWRTR